MSESAAISVQNISKCYTTAEGKELWALKDISFDLHPGEIFGVIGRNGAGKSTLLKVLSEVTYPTSGQITLNGSMSSILDVGTGFHPDLSGRENVYLSASFLGFKKADVAKRYEDIVAFSDLSEFMEQPVKHYSSGMYLRLAFSVAFHTDVDILLVDEVLSVGDLDFRKKCNQKIREIAAAGTAIIMVTHDTDQIIQFCHRCLQLEQGKIIKLGTPLNVVEGYIEQSIEKNDAKPDYSLIGNKLPVFFKSLKINGNAGSEALHIDEPIHFEIEVEKQNEEGSVELAFYLTNLYGHRVLMDGSGLRPDYKMAAAAKGSYTVQCTIPANILNRGVYTFSLVLSTNMEVVQELPELAVLKLIIPESNPRKELYQAIACSVIPQLDWTFTPTKKPS